MAGNARPPGCGGTRILALPSWRFRSARTLRSATVRPPPNTQQVAHRRLAYATGPCGPPGPTAYQTRLSAHRPTDDGPLRQAPPPGSRATELGPRRAAHTTGRR